MLAPDDTVLYVGKASSLHRRVNSYFQRRRHQKPERTLELLTQVQRMEVTVTATPLEAALLEVEEIKRLAPPYNSALREHGSSTWFATPTLDSLEPSPDDDHCLGPFHSKEPPSQLAEGSPAPPAGTSALSADGRYDPVASRAPKGPPHRPGKRPRRPSG
jgi:DNA polymerase-3 subunit epsilon